MHQALYRKWRPRTFSEVCGQEHITNVLSHEVANGRTNHAYLFCGSRGTGKTTCAKILAKAVNCEHPIGGNPCNECDACRSIDEGRATDVLEMDAASNNGVDYIRDIRDEVVYTPSAVRYRVYIIDEVHMLSASAFNALLKTLEEPPAQVIFILATTELQKIPATILSRCQRFDFRRIASPVIADRLAHIAEEEGISLEREAALQIAKLSSGGMRDSISLLELCAASGAAVNVARVIEISGGAGRETLARTAGAVVSGDIEALFGIVAEASAASKDMSVLFGELLSFYRDMLVTRCAKNAAEYLDLTPNEYEDTRQAAAAYRTDQIIYHCKLLDEAYTSMQRNASDKRLCAEITLVRMANEKHGSSTEALAARIAALEDKIAMGGIPAASAMAVQQQSQGQPAAKKAASATETASVEPSKEQAPAVQAEVKANAPARSYPGWMEAVKTFERYDRAGAAFLKQAKASISGDRVIIYVADNFTKKILESDKTQPQLLAVLRANTPTVSDYTVVCVKAEDMPVDDIDSLAADLES
ncbi:MAG: DNA polymerase III subunit gamma/tau [Clostridia bacterium]|nr:DNA polymerase III subunit gamma/tau [Clostridia bacterium]